MPTLQRAMPALLCQNNFSGTGLLARTKREEAATYAMRPRTGHFSFRSERALVSMFSCTRVNLREPSLRVQPRPRASHATKSNPNS